MSLPRLILVTDPSFGDDAIVQCVERVARALPSGALAVQVRDKSRAPSSLRVFAGRLRVVTRAVGAALLVNGPPDLARDVGADGVHLASGAASVATARAVVGRQWIFVATHSDEDVRRAARDGADAVVVSPVFASRPPGGFGPAKRGRGVAALRAARAVAGGAPVFALGGVDEHTAPACRAAGAYGVAVMKALLGGAFPGRSARAIHDAVAPPW